MSNYLDTTVFQYYPSNVRITQPLGELTLRMMLNSIKNPKPETLEIFKQIEEASLTGDKKRKDELKSKIFYFTPCVYSDGKGRCYDNITSWTGVALIDIDNLEPEVAIALKQYLFDTYKYVICSFLSVSKKGVKVLVRIPQVFSVDEFKSYFYGLMVKFQWIIGNDLAPQNCFLPSYLTYDRDLLFREDAEVFTSRGMKVDEFKVYEGEFEEVEASEEDREKIKFILKKSFEKISDSGHLICRNTCLTGWGFVAAGYFTEEEMEEYLFELIEDTPYLQSKLKTYKQTCLDMKKMGLSAPITLSKDE